MGKEFYIVLHRDNCMSVRQNITSERCLFPDNVLNVFYKVLPRAGGPCDESDRFRTRTHQDGPRTVKDGTKLAGFKKLSSGPKMHQKCP